MARVYPKRGRHDNTPRPKVYLVQHQKFTLDFMDDEGKPHFKAYRRIVAMSNKPGDVLKDSGDREYQVQNDGSVRRYGREIRT